MKIITKVKIKKDIPFASAGTELRVLQADTKNGRLDIGPESNRGGIDTKYVLYLSDIINMTDFFEFIYEERNSSL